MQQVGGLGGDARLAGVVRGERLDAVEGAGLVDVVVVKLKDLAGRGVDLVVGLGG